MHPKLKLVFSGVDIHRRTHSAVFINAFGEKLGEIKFENKPSAFEGFLKEAKKFLKRGQSFVWGLEDCEGSGRPFATFLKSKGLIVKKVNSNLSAAERKSQPGSGKTDFIDAENVARVLLTRLDILPDFSQSDIYWTIGTLVRKRASIVNNNIIPRTNPFSLFLTVQQALNSGSGSPHLQNSKLLRWKNWEKCFTKKAAVFLIL